MARIGVSYDAVFAAIQTLQAQAVNPTVDRIREALGRGSRTTILQHLQNWRAQEHITDPKRLQPSEHLHLQVETLFQNLAQEARSEAEAQVQELGQTLERAEAETAAHLQQLSLITNNLDAVTREKQALEQTLNSQAQDIKNLTEAYTQSHQELERARKMIQDQEQLLQAAREAQRQQQRNLEHYQETMADIRSQEQAEQEHSRQLLNAQLTQALQGLKRYQALEEAWQQERERRALERSELEQRLATSNLAWKAEQQQSEQLQHTLNLNQQDLQHHIKLHDQVSLDKDQLQAQLHLAQETHQILVEQLRQGQGYQTHLLAELETLKTLIAERQAAEDLDPHDPNEGHRAHEQLADV